jgi:copper(I)-binding protein
MALKDLSRKPHEKNLPIRMFRVWLTAALCMACAGLAQAAEPAARVEHARIRWLPGDLPLAGYFDLTNTGRHPLTLTGASSGAFGDVMMHLTTHSGGQAGMAPAGNLEVRPGQTLHFAPDGYHLMLMDRTRPLAVGDSVPIRLMFSGGGSMDVMFTVRGADMQ